MKLNDINFSLIDSNVNLAHFSALNYSADITLKLYFSIISPCLSAYQYEPQHADNNNSSCGVSAVFSFQISFKVFASLITVQSVSAINKRPVRFFFSNYKYIFKPTSSWNVWKGRISFAFGLSDECDSFHTNETTIIRELNAFALITPYILFMYFIVGCFFRWKIKKLSQ